MRFMLTFEWMPDAAKQAEAIERFRKTGGQPPKGAKLLGRWTRADFSGGFDLIETDDLKTLVEFSLAWSHLMRLNIIPVLEDAELTEVLARARAA
ncbi:MAG TPA: DUF3303 family protein [Candidatus Acidoferrales bacterium]|jgi:hypothetical protein|nr:DUF3303 family protein [Candidatus Acidoferrales bacterium]